MAGDPSVEEAMAYIKSHGGVDEYPEEQLKVAIDYLRNRKQQLQDLGVSNEDELRQLGELLGGGRAVPMPIRRKGRGDSEVRTHVDFDTNPITGEIEIVPVYDKSSGKVLRTEFGDLGTRHRLPGNHTKSAEYIGENILKLMDINAGVANQDIVNGRVAFERSDLIDRDRGTRIDVEVRDNPNFVPQQIYTNVYPARRNYPKTREGMFRLTNDVERMITDRAKRDNLNIQEATESLLNDGSFGPEDIKYAQGKGLKAFPANVESREDLMEQILMPEYNLSQLQLMKRRQNVAMPPQSVRMVDPQLAMERASFITGANIKPGAYKEGPLRVRPSEGDIDGRGGMAGHMRGRVYVDLPPNAVINRKPVSVDVTEEHPLVQQIMATGFKKL